MKLNLKTEYQDVYINCPFTNKKICPMLEDPEMFIHYYNKGYSFLFEIEKEVEKEVEKEIEEEDKKEN